MDEAGTIEQQRAALAAHIGARREAILQAWRSAVERDPEMTTGTSLPRSQLNDHIPDLLDAYAQKLCAESGRESAEVQAGHKEDAAAHGLQRWQQGYDLREVTREWGRLQLCLVDELDRYEIANPGVGTAVMARARRAWTEMCADGVSESTAKYFQLQQIEAGGHLRELEQALEQLQELERQRADLWREAAHDLRGNLGVVANATAGLRMDGTPDRLRDTLLRLLSRNVSSLHSLLEDVMDLARLQAGRERRQVRTFDAAATLRELCERMQPLADERGLALEARGPASLVVEGDAVKTQRIAQNLLHNSLKYTLQGGVTVSWGDSRKNDANRWMLCVQDTGPGLHPGAGAPIANALEAATEEAHDIERAATSRPADPIAAAEAAAAPMPAASAPRAPSNAERGEGIGLSIVKRLCELLDASIEMESVPGEGTTMRILLPRRYEGTGPDA